MLRTLHRAAAVLLPLAAVAYLTVILTQIDFSKLGAYLDGRVVAIASVSALLYGAGLYLLAFSWSACLRKCSPQPVSMKAAVRLYAFTTFAKYLPGNIFHYAGRQIAAARLGTGQKAPAQATLVEILGHLCAVGLLLIVLLPFALEGLHGLLSLTDRNVSVWLAIAALGGAVVVFVVLRHRYRFSVLPPLGGRLLSCVALLQLSFFILAALLGLWLAIPMLALPWTAMPLLVFVYLAAWLIGFVTPGAPGGLGVREAALLAGLSGFAAPEAILAFAVLSRISLLFGELLFALSGFLLHPASGDQREEPPLATGSAIR